MATSEKKIRANRENAKKSTGPKTVEGKNVSKRNALKHGLSGKGKVVPDAIQQQIQGRIEQWTASLKPAEGPEAWLVARAAALSARVDAAVKCEAERREHAKRDAESDRLARGRAAYLGRQLLTRKGSGAILLELEATVAGCDWLIERWNEMEARRREGTGAWSRDDLKVAMKLRGHSMSDLAGDTELLHLIQHYCAAREFHDRDTVMEYRLRAARDAEGSDPSFRPAYGPHDFFGTISLETARRILGDSTSRQIIRLTSLRAKRAREEAERPKTVSDIDLSREGERLRRYEISLDRQLHLALQRAELLRHERTADDDESDDISLRNEARGQVSRDVRPVAQSDHRAFDQKRDHVILGREAGGVFDPSVEEARAGRDDATQGWVTSQPTTDPTRGVENAISTRRTRRFPLRNEVVSCPVDARREPEAMQWIPPRRRRGLESEQAVATVTPCGPPLRGRIPGREIHCASEDRGPYVSPEARQPGQAPRMTTRERIFLATNAARSGLDGVSRGGMPLPSARSPGRGQ